LHPHRDLIRRRLLEILVTPPPVTPEWGLGHYVAVHIRLGDFIEARPTELKLGQLPNGNIDGMRIPLGWYRQVIRRVRDLFPELPVYVFSDGRDHELAEILSIDGVSRRREANDVDDLLALAQARLLIGSRSTFSRWAAFLGNMPSIWFKADIQHERSTGDAIPLLYVADDIEIITRDAVAIT